MTAKDRHPTLLEDRARLAQLFLDTPTGGKGSSKSRDDFGPPESCRTQLRYRKMPHDFTVPLEQLEGAYAFYLGQHGDKWVVAVTQVVCTGILTGKWSMDDFVGFIEYESLAELKQLWELD